MPESGYQPSVTLYVRSLCPKGAHRRQDRIVERLQEMDRTGQVAEFSVEVYGDRIPRDDRSPVDSAVPDRIETFEAWSDRAGTSLAPFFETHESGSMLTDETRTAVELPVICLAEYHHGRLQYVAPCVDDGTVCTVADRLDAIEGGDADPRRARRAGR